MSRPLKRSWRSWAGAIVGLGLAMFVAVPSLAGHRQIGYLWTFDDLTKKADCVVMAEHVRTNDTNRRTTHPELTPGYPVVELETGLNLLAVLKPCAQADLRAGTVVTLKHYTPDRDRIRGGLVNGGTALTFTTGATYLVFLKHSEGSAFEPLSGHTFPTDSVYRVLKARE